MISAAEKKALKALCGKRSKAELTALFALVRANEDRALLKALAPPKKKRKAKRDTLLGDVELCLKPLMAPAAEKAELLAEHLAKTCRREFSFTPRGLADGVRRLRVAGLSDEQIRSGAKGLIARLSQTHSGRESVV